MISHYSYIDSAVGTLLYAVMKGSADKAVVAVFNDTEEGKLAWACFTDGFARATSFSLFNENTNEFTIGTMGQLTA
jgi:hypothetical protein